MRGNVTMQQFRFIKRRQEKQDADLRAALLAQDEARQARADRRRRHMAVIALGCILTAIALLTLAVQS